MEKKINAQIFLVKKSEVNTPLENSIRRFEDNIKMHCYVRHEVVEWISCAWSQGPVLGSCETTGSLTSRVIVSFSGSSLELTWQKYPGHVLFSYSAYSTKHWPQTRGYLQRRVCKCFLFHSKISLLLQTGSGIGVVKCAWFVSQDGSGLVDIDFVDSGFA